MYPVGIEPMPLLVPTGALTTKLLYQIAFKFKFLTRRVLSYLTKSLDNSQAEPGTIPRLNLGNIPAIAGKTKLGQIPAIAGGRPCYSRDLNWEYISLL